MKNTSFLTMTTIFLAQASFLLAAADTQRLQWKPDASSSFEVSTQIRAWTIGDEGIDTILDNMQSMAGINNIYMVVVMHQEHRPYKAPEFPHNPARDAWEAEDSRVTFFPDMKRYGKIKPLLSDHEWLRQTDWLKVMVAAARARGMSTGAEVSHFPIPKALIRQNPDWQLKQIDGKGSSSRFCANNPDVREYLIALFGDLAANYDLDYIQTCQFVYDNKDIDQGGACFCEHCIIAAKADEFDLAAAIPILKKNKNAEPQRSQWIRLKFDSTTKLYRDIAAKIKAENSKCHLRMNDVFRDNAFNHGLDFKATSPYFGSVVTCDHAEQGGGKDMDFEFRKMWLTRNRKALGLDKPLLCAIAPRIDAYPELVKAGIKVAVEHPANICGLALKHYDGASFSLLRAFKQGMIDAGVQGLTPTLGQEVEAMMLDGYKPFTEELIEEWGVETTSTGKATYTFDQPSGIYDIRITYFDEENGQSLVSLLIADQERVSFKMDEDVDCWRWRRFNQILIDQGDTITLQGQAHQGEHARLDYIEFIPK